MPRKIRQLKAELRTAGFREVRRRGKGSHTYWENDEHPGVTVTLSGQDGDDARSYQEREVAIAIRLVGERGSRES